MEWSAFGVFLPIGFIWLFVDLNDQPRFLKEAIFILMSAMFWGTLVYYMIRIKTIERRKIVLFFTAILVIFVLSMKGCVSGIRNIRINLP